MCGLDTSIFSWSRPTRNNVHSHILSPLVSACPTNRIPPSTIPPPPPEEKKSGPYINRSFLPATYVLAVIAGVIRVLTGAHHQELPPMGHVNGSTGSKVEWGYTHISLIPRHDIATATGSSVLLSRCGCTSRHTDPSGSESAHRASMRRAIPDQVTEPLLGAYLL